MRIIIMLYKECPLNKLALARYLNRIYQTIPITMKNSLPKYLRTLSLMLFVGLMLSSCRKHDQYEQGPRGYDGRAFFAVSYTNFNPYSYGDNNPSIPNNPILDEYYTSNSGVYEFEYFVNPFEYWYGTYELGINFGGPGGDFGEPGLNGRDTYLTLFCDPHGFYEQRTMGKSIDEEPIIKVGSTKDVQCKMIMKKVHINDRSPQLETKYSKKN
ncbi:MAG: hypothetical protein ACI8U0_000773 [Flavobacteriales bacterium]|jgi:hypothetical protein